MGSTKGSRARKRRTKKDIGAVVRDMRDRRKADTRAARPLPDLIRDVRQYMVRRADGRLRLAQSWECQRPAVDPDTGDLAVVGEAELDLWDQDERSGSWISRGVGAPLSVDANWFRGIDGVYRKRLRPGLEEAAEEERLATARVFGVREMGESIGWTFERMREELDMYDGPGIGVRIVGATEAGFAEILHWLRTARNYTDIPEFGAAAHPGDHQLGGPIASGQRYGRLVVETVHDVGPDRHRRVDARCDCGRTCTARADHLRGGRVTSCGCRPAGRPERRAEELLTERAMTKAINRASLWAGAGDE